MIREAVVGGVESGGEHEVRIRLGDGHAGILDFLRQTTERCGHAVLHVNGRDIQIVSRAEGYVDAAGAVVGTGRSDVMHTLDAIDLLLKRNCDR